MPWGPVKDDVLWVSGRDQIPTIGQVEQWRFVQRQKGRGTALAGDGLAGKIIKYLKTEVVPPFGQKAAVLLRGDSQEIVQREIGSQIQIGESLVYASIQKNRCCAGDNIRTLHIESLPFKI